MIYHYQLTLGGEEVHALVSAKITRVENGFDIGTIVLAGTSWYPNTVTVGTAVQLDVLKFNATSGTTIFKGVVRFVVPDLSSNMQLLTLACLGSGYGFGDMVVGQEYGSQSINPTLDTITEILNDATSGLVAKYVNKILATATDSGFNYTTTSVDSITDVIPYIDFPYKPALNCLHDLIDIVTALKAGNSGPHFLITHDDKLHVKLVNEAGHSGWSKYYGGSQTDATLTYGQDYTAINLEKMGPEANYIMYYGNWRRPSNGDAWSNSGATSFWTALTTGGYNGTLSVDSTTYKVNTASLKCTNTAVGGSLTGFYTPQSQAAWNLSVFDSDFNVPTLNFYILVHGTVSGVETRIYTLDGGGSITGYGSHSLSSDGLTEYDKWYHYSLPVGPKYNSPERFQDFKWYGSPAINWAELDRIMIHCDHLAENSYVLIDGFYLGDANICRVAWNSTNVSNNKAKMKLIVDDCGKDDSLLASDDSGLMAKLAYAELLRAQKTALVGTVELPMIPDALPGNWFYIQDTDFRATKIVHTIDRKKGFMTTLHVTDDVTNGRTRLRYEDLNKQWAAIRPEWQDRSASNLKARSVDWRVTRLVKDYA